MALRSRKKSSPSTSAHRPRDSERHARTGRLVGKSDPHPPKSGHYVDTVEAAARRDVHVVPHPDGWATRREGSERAGGVYDTQREAIDRARDQARRDHVEVVIHRPDGRIRDSDIYGNDPKSRHYVDTEIRASTGRIRDKRSNTVADRISQVREGLPISELNTLATVLKISRDQLAAILGVTTRTLQRKAEEHQRLGPVASDRLARVQRILSLAIDVLGDGEKAARWMIAASRPLEGQVPLQLLDTDIGTQRVEQELYQIKYGIPA